MASLKLYLSKLNGDCDRFYQKAKCNKKFDPKRDDVWFTVNPIGINTLGNFMKKISKRLALSVTYTNHCIRATCVTEMTRAGYEARQIMKVTGHKSAESLKSYDHDNCSATKRDISSLLSVGMKTPSVASASSSISNTMSTTQVQGQHVYHIHGNFYQNCTFGKE